MKRKTFLQGSALGGLAITLPMTTWIDSCAETIVSEHSKEFKKLTQDLLRDWCDGIIKIQVMNPSDSTVHGMLKCPACDVTHGGSMDGMYPFFHMAKTTGEQKYLDAGIAAFEWEKKCKPT